MEDNGADAIARGDWNDTYGGHPHGVPRQPTERIRSLELEAILPIGVNAHRVNDLIEAHSNMSLDVLKQEFEVFLEAVAPKLPCLASKYMTWKTAPLLKNIFVGGEPDEDDDDYDDGNESEGVHADLFSPSQTDYASDTDSSDIDHSDELTILPLRNLGFGHDLKAPVAAERPLLTYVEDEQGVVNQRAFIFANDFFEVRRSLVAGWGAFAKTNLRQGDTILVEKALYHATHKEVQPSVDLLSESERKIADDLHAYFGRDGETKAEAVWNTNAFASKYSKAKALALKKTLAARHDTAGLFPVAARFNHSCEPTIQYKYDAEDEVLIFSVRSWEIEKGEELTISYGKEPSVLYYKFGFKCECGFCDGFDPTKWNY
ncbi:set domain-containing protein 5 [Colletotrichum karsti]|uniref:Set domain-containing protein 5 n=1 Tax=Colletotrichum karsti TaxID=1095194 RepID=A0A9P6IDZ1_9PEZI|nr:set domain-containing protein 5 [Colletotrichum karsti]KAF9876940.1 set domain-containing protein 5 [Colletotrichum karsti]